MLIRIKIVILLLFLTLIGNNISVFAMSQNKGRINVAICPNAELLYSIFVLSWFQKQGDSPVSYLPKPLLELNESFKKYKKHPVVNNFLDTFGYSSPIYEYGLYFSDMTLSAQEILILKKKSLSRNYYSMSSDTLFIIRL